MIVVQMLFRQVGLAQQEPSAVHEAPMPRQQVPAIPRDGSAPAQIPPTHSLESWQGSPMAPWHL